MCNLRGGSDSLRERIGYEYGLEGPEDPAEPFLSPYWDNYGGPAGTYDISESDYSVQQPPARVPIIQPERHQPQPVDSYAGAYMNSSLTC